jgi:hypothetical protein
MSQKFLVILQLIYLNLMLITIECVYIDANFYVYLNKTCLTDKKIVILTEFSNDFLIKLHFNKLKCNAFHINQNKFDNDLKNILKLLKIKDSNLLLEFKNENELFSILRTLSEDLLFMKINVNVIIVLKNKSFSDLEKKIFESLTEFRCHVLRYENNLNATQIAYIRPIINSCHSFDGILYSSDLNLKKMLTTKPSQCNLNGTVLRVVVNEVCCE